MDEAKIESNVKIEEMVDRCKHCVHRGNLDSCRNEDCGFHTLWFHLAATEEVVEGKEHEYMTILEVQREEHRKQIAALTIENGKLREECEANLEPFRQEIENKKRDIAALTAENKRLKHSYRR